MVTYILQRLGLALVTIWAISIVSFVIIQLPPGDFVDTYITNLAASGSRRGGPGPARAVRPRQADLGPVREMGPPAFPR